MVKCDELTKDFLFQDSKNININIEFLDGIRAGEILAVNEDIELNSMSISESICSSDALKFGLCEDNFFEINVRSEKEIPKNSTIKVTANFKVYEEGIERNRRLSLGAYVIALAKRITNTSLTHIEAYSLNIINRTMLPEFESWFYASGFVLDKSTANGNNIIPYSSLIWQFVTPKYNLWESEWMQYRPTKLSSAGSFYDNVARKNKTFKLYYFDLHIFCHAFALKSIDYEKNAEEAKEIYQNAFGTFSTSLKIVAPAVNVLVGSDTQAIDSSQYKFKNYESVVSLQHKNTSNSKYSVSCHAYFPLYMEIYDGDTLEKTLRFSESDEIYIRQDNGNSEYAFYITLDQTRKIGYDTKTTGYSASDDMLKNYNPAEFINSVLELNGKFGRINREGMFTEVSLLEGHDATDLYPDYDVFPIEAEDFYPLYPSQRESNFVPIGIETYSDATYDDAPCHKFGYVRVTYLATDNENYSITVECDPQYDNVYVMSDNYIFLNSVWTANEVKAVIRNHFYPLIKDIEYTPVSYTGFGIPHMEPGDPITVYGLDGTYANSYVFSRVLTGEQSFIDSVETNGTERNEDADLWVSLTDEIERG